MYTELIINEKSTQWMKGNYEYNHLFVRTTMAWIRDAYRANGYIYLERIYGLFGLRWNPYNENQCWILERDGELVFTEEIGGGSIDKFIIRISSSTDEKEES